MGLKARVKKMRQKTTGFRVRDKRNCSRLTSEKVSSRLMRHTILKFLTSTNRASSKNEERHPTSAKGKSCKVFRTEIMSSMRLEGFGPLAKLSVTQATTTTTNKKPKGKEVRLNSLLSPQKHMDSVSSWLKRAVFKAETKPQPKKEKSKQPTQSPKSEKLEWELLAQS